MDAPHRILKVLVGSQAHGLAGPGSDADYRSVFVMPTIEMFRLGYKPQDTRWVEGAEDETSWEIGRFLLLAVQGHPLILEAFLAPVIEADAWGHDLRRLFPAVWDPRTTYESFLGYCLNQRKKFLDKKDQRPEKYASAYLRVLHNLGELLETGTFTVRIVDTPVGDLMTRIKSGSFNMGEIIDLGERWTEHAAKLLSRCRQKQDLDKVNDFLTRIRKAFLT
jgi:hypothetical protein